VLGANQSRVDNSLESWHSTPVDYDSLIPLGLIAAIYGAINSAIN
jgi:hypothetical protein